MDTDHWPRVKEIFLAAVRLKPHERQAFLDEACGPDQGLRREVEVMLASHEESDDFLELPSEAGLLPDEPKEKLSLDRIGPYRIERILSAGGMGTVYEALQESPRRTVAIKVMREGIASRSALRRFEYESQILASLRHPNIAQVIEAGTHQEEGRVPNGGMPYFVMEYIEDARPITEYAWAKKLSVSDRLKLFLPVCEGVHHGHQKGIIHRDLKPSNLLVDASGKVKIIDFGVARATDSDLSFTTAKTDVGQLIGTLQYMSPEQCRADPRDLDIRSDVYALGVVLYELLCEELPYDVRKAVVFEATRVIREAPPKKPSTTKRALRGDAETIVLKALEKERAHRYQTVADLGADIRRFLEGEVILAKPAGPATRAWKRVKRHPVLSTALGVALLAALTLLGYILFVSYPQIRRERDLAEKEKRRALDAEQGAVEARKQADLLYKEALLAKAETEREAENTKVINEFLEEMISSADPFKKGGSIKLVGILDRAAERIDKEFPDRPEIEASLRTTLGVTCMNNGLYEAAEGELGKAFEICRRMHGEEHPATLLSRSNLAVLLMERGEYTEAESMHGGVLEIRRRNLGDTHPDTLSSMNNLALALHHQGRLEEAEILFREALENRRRLQGEENSETLKCMHNLANLLRDQGKLLEAESMHREVLTIRRRVLDEEHPDTLKSVDTLAIMLMDQGRYREAESMLREILEVCHRKLGEEHPNTLTTMDNLANALIDQGVYPEAASICQTILKVRRKVLGNKHRLTLNSMNNLASVLRAQGEYAKAESIHHEVLTIRREVLGEQHLDTLKSMNNLACVLMDQGKYPEAESILRKVLEIRRSILSEEHPDTLESMNNLANALQRLDKLSEAESMHRDVLRIRRSILSEEHPATLDSKNNLANILSDQGKSGEAEILYRDVLEAKRRVLGEDHPETIALTNNLAMALRDQDKLSEAEPLFIQGIESGRRIFPKGHPLKAMMHVNYGKLLRKSKRFGEAEDQLLNGYRGYKSALGDAHIKTRYAIGQLIGLYEDWDKPDKAAEWHAKLGNEQ